MQGQEASVFEIRNVQKRWTFALFWACFEGRNGLNPNVFLGQSGQKRWLFGSFQGGGGASRVPHASRVFMRPSSRP